MGKTLENESPKASLFADKGEGERFEIQLPLHLSSKEKYLDQLRGNNIAIYEEKIVAIDKSLKSLHKTLQKLIPKGKRCEIEYIEEGASVYGSGF